MCIWGMGGLLNSLLCAWNSTLWINVDTTDQVPFLSASWQHYQLSPPSSLFTRRVIWRWPDWDTLDSLFVWMYVWMCTFYEPVSVCVCLSVCWVHACASVCVKGGLWDIKDLVLYDVWHDMRRHAWNEIDCLPAEGATHTRGIISWAFSGLMSD